MTIEEGIQRIRDLFNKEMSFEEETRFETIMLSSCFLIRLWTEEIGELGNLVKPSFLNFYKI